MSPFLELSKQTKSMASYESSLHFVLFPLMAPGHMIPMVDIAKLLAHRGVTVSVITTPNNARRFSSPIARAVGDFGLRLQMVQVRFPSVEAGLPEGCENLDTLPSLGMASNFFVALNLFRKEVEQVLDGMSPPPSCLISDMGLPWTIEIAQRFNIPRIVFHGTCCFSLLCTHNIRASEILDRLESDSDYFEVPNIPNKIRLRKSQVSSFAARKTDVLKDAAEKIRAAEKSSYGVVVNTFQELETDYVKEYSNLKGEKVWCVGPVSLCNNSNLDLAERGNKTLIDGEECLKWLDSHEPKSVFYASLGSLASLTAEQMMEIGLGLEETNRPFIWVVGKGMSTAFQDMISENGFEDRIKGRGLLIRGWAPQVLILSHKSVGGFLTHCGWNSTLEGITAGVPMATWPFFADQFCNEKLVVEVLRIGVCLGVETPVLWGEEQKAGVLVKRNQVKEAVELVMDGGKEGEERRMRASEVGEKAKKAIGEEGSSFCNLSSLIEDIKALKQ